MNVDTKHSQASMNASQALDDAKFRSNAPPPPYLHTTSRTEDQLRPDAKDKGLQNDAEPTSYPTQAHHTQPASRTLHFVADGWTLNSVRVMDSDKTTVAYKIKFKIRKPHMVLTDATTGAMVGGVSYHALKSRIDTSVRNISIPLTTNSMWSCTYTFASPALGGKKLTWKTKKWCMNLTCTDEQGVLLAVYKFRTWSLKKCGKLEVYGSHLESGPLFEELLVSGMALVEYVLMIRGASAGTAGASVGAVAMS